MSDTTCLDDIPIKEINRSPPPIQTNIRTPQTNIQPQISNKESVSLNVKSSNNIPINIDVDPTIMNKVVHDIQTHTINNSNLNNTQNIKHETPNNIHVNTIPLPEKNIPTEPHIQSLMHDSSASPNYIPPNTKQYIPNINNVHETGTHVLQNLKKTYKYDKSFENIFNDLKGFIVITLLYYLFQTPYAHLIFKRIFYFGYNQDSNLNQIGMLLVSITFVITLYLTNQMQNKIIELIN